MKLTLTKTELMGFLSHHLGMQVTELVIAKPVKVKPLVNNDPDLFTKVNCYVSKEFPYFTNNSLSVKQNDVHYTGHYLKYIDNFNKLMDNNVINTIYKKYNPTQPNQRYLFLLAVIMFYDKEKKTPIYKNHILYVQHISDFYQVFD
jgi:hypothetical protein